MDEIITLTPAGKRFWGTKKRELSLRVSNAPVRPYGTYWDGGSKNEYWYAHKNGTTSAVNGLTSAPAPFGQPGISEIAIPNADTAVVEGGIFCGKDKRLRVTVLSKEGWVF
jgi:hypothetical protein